MRERLNRCQRSINHDESCLGCIDACREGAAQAWGGGLLAWRWTAYVCVCIYVYGLHTFPAGRCCRTATCTSADKYSHLCTSDMMRQGARPASQGQSAATLSRSRSNSQRSSPSSRARRCCRRCTATHVQLAAQGSINTPYLRVRQNAESIRLTFNINVAAQCLRVTAGCDTAKPCRCPSQRPKPYTVNPNP